jgi:1,4-alpha-glucan branching enzyme
VLSYLRHDGSGGTVAVVLNFSAERREDYRLGVPLAGAWRVLLDTEVERFGGSGRAALAILHTDAMAAHGRPQSLMLTLPPLSALFLKAPSP